MNGTAVLPAPAVTSAVWISAVNAAVCTSPSRIVSRAATSFIRTADQHHREERGGAGQVCGGEIEGSV